MTPAKSVEGWANGVGRFGVPNSRARKTRTAAVCGRSARRRGRLLAVSDGNRTSSSYPRGRAFAIFFPAAPCRRRRRLRPTYEHRPTTSRPLRVRNSPPPPPRKPCLAVRSAPLCNSRRHSSVPPSRPLSRLAPFLSHQVRLVFFSFPQEPLGGNPLAVERPSGSPTTVRDRRRAHNPARAFPVTRRRPPSLSVIRMCCGTPAVLWRLAYSFCSLIMLNIQTDDWIREPAEDVRYSSNCGGATVRSWRSKSDPGEWRPPSTTHKRRKRPRW